MPPSLSLQAVRQGHWACLTGLTHRKKHRPVLIGFKLASSTTAPSLQGRGTDRGVEEREGDGKRRREVDGGPGDDAKIN